MFLKSLEVFGFKSFADKTRIEFSEGISALLGPNGCGKSNVVDAIKWVLGEQASKSMRAEKMEDVIFNGTEARKPVNVAEVSIGIENANGILNLDLPEIIVKRRLYRSGESEYYINGNLCKLKELRELFWDTGIGKSAYSVMEQGRIDQILSSKPEERRYLFEEAAGITRFKVRGLEAERKLERTEENMRQVDGILGEVKRSHDGLKIQADKTLKYRSYRDQIFELELDIQLLRLRAADAEAARKKEEIEKRTKARDEAKAEIDAANLALQTNMDVVNDLEAALVEHQKTLYGLAIEKNNKEKQRTLILERSQEAKSKIQADAIRKKSATERIEGLNEEIDEKTQGLRALIARAAELQANITSFEANVKLAADRIDGNDKTSQKREGEVGKLEEENAGLQEELAAITEDIVTELDKRLKDSGYSMQERVSREEAIDRSLGTLRVLVSGKRAMLEDFISLKDRPREESDSLLKIAHEALTQAGASVEELASLFAAYRAASPSFIDEFLSPEGIITKKRSIDDRILSVKDGMAARRVEILSLRDENRELTVKIDEYRATLEELRVNQAMAKAQATAAEESLAMIRRDLAQAEAHLKEIENGLYVEEKRLGELNEQITELDEELASIETKGKELTKELERLEKEINKKNSDVASRREALAKKAEQLTSAASILERLFLEQAQIKTEMSGIRENFREQHSRDLSEFEERMFEIREQPSALREKLAEARAKLKDLGSVNLMAPEEYAEVKQRYEFLTAQLDDLKKARDDLDKITQEIRTESTELFLATYNKIKKNFHNMFRRLLGGGRAELKLIDPDHVLESGIEIYAQPPGKRLENIGLLSGGEKSMTAVALLFATYMVKPSPFCFLDEIDAALDEQNVLRFVNLLREFGRTSQFIVITHNKKTVTGASTLLGVTMEEAGVTKVIAVRLEKEGGGIAEPLAPPEPFEEEEVEPETGRELPPEEDEKK